MKHVLLAVILVVAVWALWPPAGSTPANPAPAASTEPSGQVKYVLRIDPGIYMPGTRPANVGSPLVGMDKVARRFEKLFPDTRIEFVQVPSGMREWLVTQLSSAQAPDVIQVNVEDVWQDVQKGWYVPLDAYLEKPDPFIPPGQAGSKEWWDLFKYQAITRGKAAPDGLSYCISYDMVETGIFYNKDLFQQLGLKEPQNWDEFLALQEKLKAAGHIPLAVWIDQLVDWGIDLPFDQLYYNITPLVDLVKDPKRAQYLANYLDWDEICFLHSKGFFSKGDPRWVDLWRILKQWRQYMSQDLSNDDMIKLFMTHRAAMTWASSEFVNKLSRDPDMDFHWGVFYPPPFTKSTSPYASGKEMCVIGGSAMQYSITNSAYKDTGDIKTSERLKRVVAFLQFATTPESENAVVNEIVSFLPNVVGVQPRAELVPFDKFLQRRYTTTKWYFTFDLEFDEIMKRMLELYLNGGISEEQFLAWMERNLDSASANIVRRKRLDFGPFQKIWDQRADLRKSLPGLPAEAR